MFGRHDDPSWGDNGCELLLERGRILACQSDAMGSVMAHVFAQSSCLGSYILRRSPSLELVAAWASSWTSQRTMPTTGVPSWAGVNTKSIVGMKLQEGCNSMRVLMKSLGSKYGLW